MVHIILYIALYVVEMMDYNFLNFGNGRPYCLVYSYLGHRFSGQYFPYLCRWNGCECSPANMYLCLGSGGLYCFV